MKVGELKKCMESVPDDLEVHIMVETSTTEPGTIQVNDLVRDIAQTPTKFIIIGTELI